jgi:hypothetical protein
MDRMKNSLGSKTTNVKPCPRTLKKIGHCGSRARDEGCLGGKPALAADLGIILVKS